jgi:hypothetical protein
VYLLCKRSELAVVDTRDEVVSTTADRGHDEDRVSRILR